MVCGTVPFCLNLENPLDRPSRSQLGYPERFATPVGKSDAANHHVIQALARAVEVRRELKLRALLEDFAGNQSGRWSGLHEERRMVAEHIRELQAKGAW